MGKFRALLATPSRKIGPERVIQPVEKNRPFPIHIEASRGFAAALHDAVSTSVASMEELRQRLTPCVAFLKSSGLGPAEMILSIKACARDHAKERQAHGDEFAVANANTLMEQIVKWAIAEYYSSE